jgi:hypothetical protein
MTWTGRTEMVWFGDTLNESCHLMSGLGDDIFLNSWIYPNANARPFCLLCSSSIGSV